MNNDLKLIKHHFRIWNSQAESVEFQLEPDGTMFTIPPGGKYDIVWKQDADRPVDFVFDRHDDGTFFYSLGTSTFWPNVYDNGELIYGKDD